MTEVVRRRLLDRLESRLPVVVIEGWAGAGKRTLLRQWAAESDARLLVDLGRRDLDATGLCGAVLAVLEEHGVVVDGSIAPRAAVVAALASWGGTTVGLIGVERVDPPRLIDLMAEWCRDSGVRSVVATRDATALVLGLDRLGTPHRRLDDADLRLDHDELAELVRSVVPGVDDAVLGRLDEVSGGAAGWVAEGLRSDPDAIRDGVLPDLHADWIPEPVGPFEEFLATAIVSPRVGLTTLAHALDVTDLPRQVERVVALGWATREVVPHVGPVLRWIPRWRERMLRQAGAARSSHERDHRVHLAEEAGRQDDLELQVSLLVDAGDLERAARVARECLWELMATADLTLWSSLVELPVAALMDQPALASLRMVLRLRMGHRVVRGSVVRELRRRHPSGPTATGVPPSDRFHRLATAMYVAARYGETDLARGALREVRGFADLLPDLVLESGSVSDLLLVLEALVRIDRPDLASVAAAHALRVLEMDADRLLDPRGRRRDHVELVAEMCARHVGDPTALSRPAAPEHRVDEHRELDVVARAVVRGWEALDGGDPAKACALTVEAMRRVDPVDWPLLLVVHLLAAAGDGDVGEIQRVWNRYLKRPAWRGRHVGGASARELDALCVRILRVQPPVSPPQVGRERQDATGTLPLHADGGVEVVDRLEALNPRSQQMALVAEATRATRADELEHATAALARAVDCAPGSGLVPVLLGTARPDDLDRLRKHLAAGSHPELAALLDTVVPVGRSREEVPALSDREREVLAHLRAGRTNRDIAEALFLSANTVKFHRANLYRKLGADSRDRLLATAHRLGL